MRDRSAYQRVQNKKYMNVGTNSIFRWSTALSIAILLCALLGFITSHDASAATGINSQINFQGRLLNAQGATVPDGFYNIQFKIYQDGDGLSVGNTTGSPAGSLKWTESHLNSAGKGVQVKNGFLSVQLGSVTAFGASIDWNQDTLWLSMNVGNTNGSCTPFTSCGGDGEMVPMKRLSATPYAVNAGMLGGKTANDFIQSTTALQQANLAIQSANSASIGVVVQGAASQTADVFQVKSDGNANPLLAVASSGSVNIRPTASGDVAAFSIKSSAGANVFTVDASNNRVGVGLGGSTTPSLSGAGMQVQGAIRLTGGGGANADTFTTPLGASVSTKINIPLYDPGANSQVVAFGLSSGANVDSRAITLYDARTGAHQPTVAVMSPDESKVFGLSWDGSNTAGYVKTSSDSIHVQANGLNVFTAQNASGTGQLTLNGNAAIAAGRSLTLGAACSAGQFLTTNAGAVVGCQNSTAGVATLGTLNSQTKSGDGAVIVGTTLYLQSADASNPGLIDTSSQTIAGAKTFTSGFAVNTAAGFTGNLMNLSVNSSSKFSVNEAGNTAVAGTFTSTGNISTTGQYQIGGNTLLTSSALTFTGATANSIAGTNNQSLSISGGAATTANANGSSLNLSGGSGNGTGVKGLVNIGPSAQTAVTNASCAVNCTISQANVDGYGTIVINASVTDITITLPPPTITSVAGRTVYIATAGTSQDFTLQTNTGGDLIDVAMRKNTTSTMIWNGTAWTPGGASNATTLQATYNNGSNPSTTPEIKLDTIRGTIDIQDADTSIGTDILNIRGSNASGLGTVLFGVSNEGRVTIQGTTDQNSAFRVLGSNGDYLFNINSSNSYVISNATRSPGNEISNPGFETGGSLTSGEEGWFGPATGSISNDPTNAKAGNHVLAVTSNSSNADFYAGKYYEVEAGEGLYLEGWVKGSAGANGNAGIQITWFDKDKGVLGYSTGYPNNPGTSYVLRTVTAVAPANAHYARVSATIRSNATTGTYYFDGFYMKRNLENADMLFRNSVDSTTAFRIQSAGAAQTLFTANTTNNTVKIGDNTGTGADTTLLVLDSATADPSTLTGLNGGIFYRSDNNSLKAIIGGAVVDICTTAITCSGYSASAGSAISLQATSPGTAQVGNFNISGTGILTQLQTQDNGTGSTQSLTIRTGNATGGNSGNLIIDVGTATGVKGTITIGSANVTTTMPGNLSIQGSNTLTLGKASGGANPADGSILFRSSGGANTITLKAPSTDPSSSYTLTLPTGPGAVGECIKTDATGNMYFQGCGVGINFNLQDAYNNSATPADITLADGKDFQITAPDAGTDPSIVFKLNCALTCGSGGRFKVQNGTTDILSVLPNGGGIVLGAYTQVGSSSTDSVQVNFQLDSYNGTADVGGCSTTVNQGVLYYNTNMGSIRSCINGSWSDVSNPDTLGLLTFGIVPSSGPQPYDLPSLVTPGYSGPCKVSWYSINQVRVEQCTAYSNGRRLSVPARILSTNTATSPNTSLTTTNRWGHVCLNPTSGEPEFTSSTGLAAATNGMPTFSASSPILCLADVQGSSTTAGTIDNLYDVRTFTSAMKEAVTAASPIELGMMADSSATGIVPSAACSSGTCSGKLYGLVVATDGGTSAGAPNAIVVSVGPGFVKSISGNAGEFAKASTTAGYASTVTAIPNNAFYFSPGNTRTAYSTTCSATNNCSGSMYVNFIVR